MIEDSAQYVDMHQSSNYSCLPSLDNNSQLKLQTQLFLLFYPRQNLFFFHVSPMKTVLLRSAQENKAIPLFRQNFLFFRF